MRFLFLFTLGILGVNMLSSQSIDGSWIIRKGTTDITLIIEGKEGKISSISSTKDFTTKILDGSMYTEIASAGPRKWNAVRHTWKFNGLSREDQENGKWKEVGPCQFSLSEDGNTLSVSGHWTWKRKNPLSASKVVEEVQSNDVIAPREVNYEGLKVTYQAVKNSKGTKILMRAKNTLNNIDVGVDLSNSNGVFDRFSVEPNSTITKTIDHVPFEITVSFSKNKRVTEPLDDRLLNLIKKKVKDHIEVNGKRIERETGGGGIRG